MATHFDKILMQNLQSNMHNYSAIFHRHPYICIAPVPPEDAGVLL